MTTAYLPAPAKDMGEILKKLSPAEQKIYVCRMATDPPRSQVETATLLGITSGAVSSTWSKIRAKLGYDPMREWKEIGKKGSSGEDFERFRNVSPVSLLRQLETNLDKLLRAFSQEKIEKATVSELSAAVERLGKYRQILRGEPTQIISTDQRANMLRLLPAVIKQLGKYGVTVEMSEEGMKAVPQLEAENEPQAVDG